MNNSDNNYKKRKAMEPKSCLQKCKEMLKNKQNKRVHYFLSRDLNLSFEDQNAAVACRTADEWGKKFHITGSFLIEIIIIIITRTTKTQFSKVQGVCGGGNVRRKRS